MREPLPTEPFTVIEWIDSVGTARISMLCRQGAHWHEVGVDSALATSTVAHVVTHWEVLAVPNR
jgi:hypothetical protein